MYIALHNMITEMYHDELILFCFLGGFTEVQRKLARAEQTSDLQSSEDVIPSKRKKM